jgi:hypothetical protein
MKNQDLYIQAVKQCVSANLMGWVMRTSKESDETFARNGPSVNAIAAELDSNCGFIRPQLDKLVKKGLLIKSCRGGIARYWPMGYVNEIKAIKL